MSFECLGIEACQVVQGRTQADHPGDRRRACLEPQWCRTEAGALVFGQLHHLTAELPVVQPFQRLAAAVQHTDAFRAV